MSMDWFGIAYLGTAAYNAIKEHINELEQAVNANDYKAAMKIIRDAADGELEILSKLELALNRAQESISQLSNDERETTSMQLRTEIRNQKQRLRDYENSVNLDIKRQQVNADKALNAVPIVEKKALKSFNTILAETKEEYRRKYKAGEISAAEFQKFRQVATQRAKEQSRDYGQSPTTVRYDMPNKED